MHDAVRGVGEALFSDNTSAEWDGAAYFGPFQTDGFRLSPTTVGGSYNASSENYVSWNWLAGTAPTADNSASAGATPTAGSVKIDGSNLGSALAGTIAATRLSANTTSGFSIVKYNGNDTAGATLAHGLGVAPDLVMIKSLGAGQGWVVTSPELGTTGDTYGGLAEYYILTLNTTDAKGDWSQDTIYGLTSTTFSIGSSGPMIMVNNSSYDPYVAYCFASVEGYSKIGSYVGNDSTDGAFVYTGLSPAWLMIKRIDTANTSTNLNGSHWGIVDIKRNTYNPRPYVLLANSSADEDTTNMAESIDLLSNGFKFNSGEDTFNGVGTYIYMAFAESPFKYSNAR